MVRTVESTEKASLPSEFVRAIERERSDGAALIESLSAAPVVSARVNLGKVREASHLYNRSPDAGVAPLPIAASVPWCSEGHYLSSRPEYVLDPLWHAGAYYSQEASSMFLAHVLRALPGTVPEAPLCLDLCAAPGGKSLILQDWAATSNGLVVSNEVVPPRARILQENVAKWGHPGTLVTRATAAQIGQSCPGMFHVLLVDAPCSGEGMMRKDPEARRQWTPGLRQQCAALQREILRDAWPALRPGGVLLYSTCTFNPAEDAEQVSWLRAELGASPVPVAVPEEWGVECDEGQWWLLPHKVRGEGLFMSASIKEERGKKKEIRGVSGNLWRHRPELDLGRCEAWQQGERVWLQPAAAGEAMRSLSSLLPTLSCGVDGWRLLNGKRGEVVLPGDGLTLWQGYTAAAPYPTAEVDGRTAQLYLRGETRLTALEGTEGYTTVAYQNVPLGLVKGSAKGLSNLWPKTWRVRKL